MIVTVIILLILSISVAESSHFYGGTVTWKAMNNTATDSTISVMFTQSYQFKRSINIANAYDYCNDTIIMNRSPKIPDSLQTLKCISTACGNYSAISINEYCTDFSSILDGSSGQISTIEDITAGAKFCVAFQDFSWISVWSTLCTGGCFSNYSGGWSIVSCIDLTMRSDGFINTPPVATIISPIKVPINTITNIAIPVIDADGDYLKCRWGKSASGIDECASVCQSVPGATIDPDDCILTFNSSGKTVGSYYAAALMVEDFSNATSSTPFSSVPIQFLILIVNTPACPLKPVINSTLPTCVALQVGVQFDFKLTINSGCSGTTVVDFYTNPPSNMYKGVLTRIGVTNVWAINETWIPTSNQLGSQVYCALAIDSANITSNQYCLTFFVVSTGSPLLCPGQSPTTSTTTTSSTTTSKSTSTTSPTSTTSFTTTIMISMMTTISTTTSATTTSTDTVSVTISETTTTSTKISTVTTSTNTNVTTPTSVMTTFVITTLTNSKGGREQLTPWIIALSILGFLALCALCCCCWWWWLFFSGGRYQRFRRDKEKKIKNGYLPTKSYHSKKFSVSVLKNLRQPIKSPRISVIEPPDPSLLSKRAITMSSFASPTYQSLFVTPFVENKYVEPIPTKSHDAVHVTYVNRPQKPLSTNRKKHIERSIDYNNDVSNINSNKISVTKLPQNVTMSKVKRSESLTSNIEIFKAHQSNLIIRKTSFESLPATKRNNSVRVSKVKRLSLSNNIAQSSTEATHVRTSRIVIVPRNS